MASARLGAESARSRCKRDIANNPPGLTYNRLRNHRNSKHFSVYLQIEQAALPQESASSTTRPVGSATSPGPTTCTWQAPTRHPRPRVFEAAGASEPVTTLLNPTDVGDLPVAGKQYCSLSSCSSRWCLIFIFCYSMESPARSQLSSLARESRRRLVP